MPQTSRKLNQRKEGRLLLERLTSWELALSQYRLVIQWGSACGPGEVASSRQTLLRNSLPFDIRSSIFISVCLPSTSQNISLPPVFSWHYPLITLRPRGLCNSFAILATLKFLIDIDSDIDKHKQPGSPPSKCRTLCLAWLWFCGNISFTGAYSHQSQRTKSLQCTNILNL